ncbi:MAG: HNH endonuclease signature motif containing protein [Caldilineaceae bacterium]
MTYISTRLRQLVIERARHSCEYCLLHEDYTTFSHEVDHIFALKHGGRNELSNFAYACAQCNRFKGSDLSSLDPIIDEIVLLFNPRINSWFDHFDFDGPLIRPHSSIGRATEKLLQFNQIDRVLLRKELLIDSRYPFQFGK